MRAMTEDSRVDFQVRAVTLLLNGEKLGYVTNWISGDGRIELARYVTRVLPEGDSGPRILVHREGTEDPERSLDLLDELAAGRGEETFGMDEVIHSPDGKDIRREYRGCRVINYDDLIERIDQQAWRLKQGVRIEYEDGPEGRSAYGVE